MTEREREREDRALGEGDEIGRRSILICRQKREGGGVLANVCLCESYLKVTAAPASHPRRAGGRDPDMRVRRCSRSADAVAWCQKAADSQNTFLTVAQRSAVGRGADRSSARREADGWVDGRTDGQMQ